MRTRRLRLMAKSMAALALGLGMTMPSQAAVVALKPSTVVAAVGDAISFDLAVSGVSDLYGFQFSLQFDQNLLNLSGLSEGPALGTSGTTFFVPGVFDNVDGLLGLTGDTLIGAVSGFSGDGILASITFTAVGAGIGTITLNDVFLLNSSFGVIDTTSNSASFEVVGTGGVIPEPPTYGLVLLALAAMTRSGCQRATRVAV